MYMYVGSRIHVEHKTKVAMFWVVDGQVIHNVSDYGLSTNPYQTNLIHFQDQ